MNFFQAMLEAQKYLSTKVKGFRFFLGYSSRRFQLSNDSREREGDAYLIQSNVAEQFRWFCHTSNHIKPHRYTEAELYEDFEVNKEFAEVNYPSMVAAKRRFLIEESCANRKIVKFIG